MPHIVFLAGIHVRIRRVAKPQNTCEQTTTETLTHIDVMPFTGTAKDRVAIPRVQMNELTPDVRVRSIHAEVNQGLTPEQAICESHRCLNCKTPTCVQGCPVNINIPGFIKQLEHKYQLL